MIDDVNRKRVNEEVFRLRRPVRRVYSDLARRGVRPEALGEVMEIVGDYVPLTLEDAVLETFRARDGQTPPFPVYRFGDGSYGVFYTALEEETSVEEMRYHTKQSLVREDGQARTLQLIACDFVGEVADLVGLETRYPDLVSQDTSGYPFCQETARLAIEQGVDALHAPSARHTGGVCAPIFAASAISNPQHRDLIEFRFRDGELESRKISST